MTNIQICDPPSHLLGTFIARVDSCVCGCKQGLQGVAHDICVRSCLSVPKAQAGVRDPYNLPCL